MLEYKLFYFNDNENSERVEGELNAFATEGWRFTSVLTRDNYTDRDDRSIAHCVMLFSRETKTVAEVINEAVNPGPVGDPRGA